MPDVIQPDAADAAALGGGSTHLRCQRSEAARRPSRAWLLHAWLLAARSGLLPPPHPRAPTHPTPSRRS
jgi:hypothetical protein